MTLTATAARGFAWMTAQTIAAKVVTLGGQVVLAWLLTREHFGLIGLAYTVMGFASVIQQGGLRQVLVQRQDRFRLWANPAFWLGLSLSVLAGLLMVVAAPLVAEVYGEKQVLGLVLVLALSMPIDGLAIVPMARLQSQLRFRTLATIAGVTGVGQMALTILFAWWGWGAYSFAIARVIGAAMTTSIAWYAARGIPIRRRRDTRRWRFLLSDSTLLFIAALIDCCIHQGGMIVLGLLQSVSEVGLFSFSYNLSLQSIQLIALNLEGVLFPTLSKLKDDVGRQIQAFYRATSALATIAVPLCFMQAAAADCVIRLIFDIEKWADAIPVVQLLSAGMAVSASCISVHSVTLAQGRFRAYLLLRIVLGAAYFGIVACGASAGGAVGAAAGASAYYLLASFVVAVHPAGGGLRDFIRTLGPPMLASALAIGPAWWISALLPDTRVGLVAQGATIGCVGLGLYLPLVRVLMPSSWRELSERVGPLLRRFSGSRAR
jgi:PST family polysaccharide transporter